MVISKILLLVILETVVFLIAGNVVFFLLFASTKKKNALLSAAANTAAAEPPATNSTPESDEKPQYQSHIEESLQQLSEALPTLTPCSDPDAFAAATDEDQAKIIRYLVLDYEKQIIENIAAEEEMAAPFVASIDKLFSAPSEAGKSDETTSEQQNGEQSEQVEVDHNAEIEQLSNQNRMNQEVIDQFARESREMLNCISTLENENKDLRDSLNVK